MKRHRSIPYLWLYMTFVNGAACFGQIRQKLWGLALLSGILMLSSLIFAVGEECEKREARGEEKKNKKKAADKEARERAQLERLKKKYEE